MRYLILLLLLTACDDTRVSNPSRGIACAERDKLQHQYFMECLQNRRQPNSTVKDNEDDVIDSCHSAAARDVRNFIGCQSYN